jgi:hypothetical protein
MPASVVRDDIGRPHRTLVSGYPRWLAPAFLVLVPTALSFLTWAVLIGWCAAGQCPAGSWMELRGFLQPAAPSIPGVILLLAWYTLVVTAATIGWRVGLDSPASPDLVERTGLVAFERRFFLVVLVVAVAGVGVSYATIAGSTSIVGPLAGQTGNSFSEALPNTAGPTTLRYAAILAAPIGVYLWRKKVIGFAYAGLAVVLLLMNGLIASRMSLLMAVAVYVVIKVSQRVRSGAGRPRASRGTTRWWPVAVAVLVLFGLLTVMNLFRNGNYYREHGVSNPVTMNLYQMGSYLAVPAQVSLGVSDAIMDGRFDLPGDIVESYSAALPSFLLLPSEAPTKSEIAQSRYGYTVSFSENFTTNSEFADTYIRQGIWGLVYTLALFPFAGFLYARLLSYGPVVAGGGGLIAYCLCEVWRIQLLTQGIVVFLILLTGFAAAAASVGLVPAPLGHRRLRQEFIRQDLQSPGSVTR